MNSEQQKVINECPAAYKGFFARAYAGESRSDAVKAMCLRCVGFLKDEVRHCTAYGCPLHPYRPYQDQ